MIIIVDESLAEEMVDFKTFHHLLGPRTPYFKCQHAPTPLVVQGDQLNMAVFIWSPCRYSQPSHT